MILIIDFGSQTCHLISRRIKELGVKTAIITPENAIGVIDKVKPFGIIFSGGPSSVYEKNAPNIDKKIFDFGIPILGICYGQQLISRSLRGDIKPGKIKEYGPAVFSIGKHALFKNIPLDSFTVWMSHGDEVVKVPPGFKIIASSENIRAGAIANDTKQIFAVQFHPEVEHTRFGTEILKNFVNICGVETTNQTINIKAIISGIKKTVGKKKIIMAFSGGTDSFVAGALIAKAVGRQLIPVYVDSGLMRKNALYNVSIEFPKLFGIKPKVIRAKKLFLHRLNKVTDPEKKRKLIGALYIKLFDQEATKHKNAEFLGQGTTYADFIHSKSTKHAALIKSHHNVGGLPKRMKLKLLEPIRYFYTDQVRYIGKKLGLPDNVVFQEPFPGPGFAVRIMGEVSHRRLDKVIMADTIVQEEIVKNNLRKSIFQAFAIITGSKSTAVKGDGRFYGDVIAVRAYTTKDRMTADVAQIPYPVLQKISTRIVNEVPEISRVVYDITTKPPATMEWE